MMASPEVDSLKCTVCGTEFQRQDHLRRHLLLHEGSRHFHCTICNRDFARRDALARHQLVHDPVPPSRSSTNATEQARAPRACTSCRLSKQRCDGADPCSRCSQKSKSCQYLTRRRRQPSRWKKNLNRGLDATGGEVLFDWVDDVPAPPSLSEDHPTSWEDEQSTVGIASQPQQPMNTMLPAPPDIFDSAWTDLCSMDDPSTSAGSGGCFTISSFQELGCQQHALHHTFEDLLDPLATYISPPADLNLFFPGPSMQPSGQNECGTATAAKLVDWDGELEDLGHVERLSAESYESLALWVEMKGLTWAHRTGTPSASAAGPPQLPPLQQLNAYIQLYFEHFHDSFSIIHRPTFDPCVAPPLLVLVVAIIGRRFSSLPSAGNLSNELGLGNFVHHAALRHVEDFESSETIPVWLAQAITLSQLGMYFTNSRPEIQRTLANRAVLSSLLPKIKRSLAAASYEHDDCSDNRRQWKTWIHCEALQRTAYGIWLLDSQCCLFFDVTPVILTELLQFALPCHESLWEKCSAESWKQQWTGTKKTPTLREEMESLYRLTAVSEDIGAFSFLIILFGCFRDSLFLKQCEDMGLKALLNMHGEPITWGGRHHPEKWRLLDPSLRSRSNDVNLITAQYYHMIRIVLHIPLKDLLAFSGWQVSLQEQQETRWRLMSWVSEHSDSAREVALHAGALFRQCRSHPTSGYQEPVSVLIATIALWVYNSSLPNHILQHKTTAGDQQRTPTFRLDNETDKDNILLWIKNGERMRPFIVGIGNIHASKSYAKVLRVGSNFLAQLQQWRISELFRSVFEDILVVLEL